jgi:hypothetical protein
MAPGFKRGRRLAREGIGGLSFLASAVEIGPVAGVQERYKKWR